MPAYRSTAEAEVRDAVVTRLRQFRPEARIMHEVNCSLFGPNRIDVLAVSPEEIISVEVKSAKDKLDRLPAQIASMRGMSHHVIAALHQKHLTEKETNEFCAMTSRDGKFWMLEAPLQARGSMLWAYPEVRRAMMPEPRGWDHIAVWRAPKPSVHRAIPGSIDMLWADEMRQFCSAAGIAVGKRATREALLPMIRWRCTGEQITKGVCRLLRARNCPEADAPVEDVT